MAMVTAGGAWGQAVKPIFSQVYFGSNPAVLLPTTPLPNPGDGTKTTTLNFVIFNPGDALLENIKFDATLGAKIKIATPNGQSGTCGGGLLTAAVGGQSVSLSGAQLSGFQSCTLTVNVIGVAAGTETATAQNLISSTTGGFSAPVSAQLSVVAPPQITKQFVDTRIPLNATTTINFTISNPSVNTVDIENIKLADSFPFGFIQIANPSGLSLLTCGGVNIQAPAGGSGVDVIGATLPPGASCAFSVNVVGKAIGKKTNTAIVTTANTVPGQDANADLTIVGPPSITKAFLKPGIKVGDSVTLRFFLNSPANDISATLNNVRFDDNIPAGLTVLNPTSPASVNVCVGTTGGQVITTAGKISYSGGTFAPNASCTFDVVLKGVTQGVQVNITDPITANESGPGNRASAKMSVLFPPKIVKTFTPTQVPLNTNATITLRVTNPNSENPVPPPPPSFPPTGTLHDIVVTDNLGAGQLEVVFGRHVRLCVDLSGFAPGVYFLKIQAEQGAVVRRIVLQ